MFKAFHCVTRSVLLSAFTALHYDPSVAMDLIAEAYKERVEDEQYAELLKMIHVYKQKLKPMSYKNHEGLPNMRLAAGWFGWWPACNQNAFWVCHTQEGAQPTGDPDDFCPCYRPPPPGGGSWCCPKEEEAPPPPPAPKPKDIIGCTCMGTHCSCLMCHVIAEMVPFKWTEEKIYTIVEANDTPVICRTPKEVPHDGGHVPGLTMPPPPPKELIKF